MQQHQYVAVSAFLRIHTTILEFLHFFATEVIYGYVALPFVLVWSSAGRQYVVIAGVGLIVAWGIGVQAVALFLPRWRPYQEYKFRPLGGTGIFSHTHTTPNAFPSGHTTALTMLTLTALLFSPWLGVLSACITLCTAAARVLLGYHFVRDIFAGLALSVLIFAALYYSGLIGYILAFIS
jgi:membrane-associated phospholipid phosphatase